MESKECRICHRLGSRGFSPYGESMWRCTREELCNKRRAAKGYDRQGNTPNPSARSGELSLQPFDYVIIAEALNHYAGHQMLLAGRVVVAQSTRETYRHFCDKSAYAAALSSRIDQVAKERP